MMEWTDRHERYFLRLLSRRTLLYTEMITTGALLRGDAPRHLRFDAAEHPVALQLGGADRDALAACAALGDEWGYDEINLNIGCPSDRVQAARFGACLMAEPALVRDCVSAMRRATAKPVTVKSRIGIDDRDSYEDLYGFVACVAESGCDTFIVHARKALLRGLNPKQNREIPPLHYEYVYRLKDDFPNLTVVLNGGVLSLDAASEHLEHVDGVMIGRAAYRDPWILAAVGSTFVRRRRTDCRAPGRGRPVSALCGGATVRRRAAARHDAPYSRTVQWVPRGAAVAAFPERKRLSARRGHRRNRVGAGFRRNRRRPRGGYLKRGACGYLKRGACGYLKR